MDDHNHVDIEGYIEINIHINMDLEKKQWKLVAKLKFQWNFQKVSFWSVDSKLKTIKNKIKK